MCRDVYLTSVCKSSTTILCALHLLKEGPSVGETSQDLPSNFFCAVINRSAVKVSIRCSRTKRGLSSEAHYLDSFPSRSGVAL